MAQIFISHSAKDAKPIEFLNKAFASTNVQAKYEEIEAMATGRRTAAQIRADIAISNAIMVVLGPNAETLRHTRDWIAWESGNAANKDVWVLEAFEDSDKLSLVIPHLRHYIAFHYNDQWLTYLRQIISSYDDSHVLPAGVAGGFIGSAIGGEAGGVIGGVIGGILGLAYGKNLTAQTRPAGLSITCLSCHSVYSVHVGVPLLRCPVCNARIQFADVKTQAAAAGGQSLTPQTH
jgi:hypothetical protein